MMLVTIECNGIEMRDVYKNNDRIEYEAFFSIFCCRRIFDKDGDNNKMTTTLLRIDVNTSIAS